MRIIVLLVVFIAFTINIKSQVPIAQEYSKELTERSLIEHILQETNITGPNLYVGELDVFTADASGELSTAYYSFLDTSLFILAFYNPKWNDYGVVFKLFAFKTLDIETAKDLLLFADNMYKQYAGIISSGDYQGLEDDQFVIAKRAGIKLFMNKDREVYIYWPEEDMVAKWNISNLRTAKRRFERTIK